MIDRKCKVTLGGLPQKIHVKGDETKPVLLFLQKLCHVTGLM